jgi:hypothetical protein
MEFIVIAVAAVIIIGGFLYVYAATVAEAKAERENIIGYFSDLVIQGTLNLQTERDAWATERASLLERIQRPEQLPPTPVTGPKIINDEINDDLHLVGTVVEGPDEAA